MLCIQRCAQKYRRTEQTTCCLHKACGKTTKPLFFCCHGKLATKHHPSYSLQTSSPSLFGLCSNPVTTSIAKAGARAVTISARNQDTGEKAAARLAERTPSCQVGDKANLAYLFASEVGCVCCGVGPEQAGSCCLCSTSIIGTDRATISSLRFVESYGKLCAACV